MSTASVASTSTVGFSEKLDLKDHGCTLHGPSQTPRLDVHLDQPKVREALRVLGSVGTGSCTRCTTEALGVTLAAYVKDLRAAKNSGELSKEERKAMKKEAKFLFKGVKKDIKTVWKD